VAAIVPVRALMAGLFAAGCAVAAGKYLGLNTGGCTALAFKVPDAGVSAKKTGPDARRAMLFRNLRIAPGRPAHWALRRSRHFPLLRNKTITTGEGGMLTIENRTAKENQRVRKEVGEFSPMGCMAFSGTVPPAYGRTVAFMGFLPPPGPTTDFGFRDSVSKR
jgi:hypothetical protein